MAEKDKDLFTKDQAESFIQMIVAAAYLVFATLTTVAASPESDGRQSGQRMIYIEADKR